MTIILSALEKLIVISYYTWSVFLKVIRYWIVVAEHWVVV